MTNDKTQHQVDNPEKPKIEKVQYNIPGLERSFEVEQEYNDFEVVKDVDGEKKKVDSIRIIFENGAKYRLSKLDEKTVQEETFEKNDPNSAWESNSFDAEDLVKATEVIIEEYQQDSRKNYKDFDDWYIVQEVVF